jgi:hypothetical protein
MTRDQLIRLLDKALFEQDKRIYDLIAKTCTCTLSNIGSQYMDCPSEWELKELLEILDN